MKTKTKILIAGGVYLFVAIALLLIFGNDGKNEEFKPQNEFKLPGWISIKIGPLDLSINRAVFYLLPLVSVPVSPLTVDWVRYWRSAKTSRARVVGGHVDAAAELRAGRWCRSRRRGCVRPTNCCSWTLWRE